MHTPGRNTAYPILLHQMLCHGYPRGTIAAYRFTLAGLIAAGCLSLPMSDQCVAQTSTLDSPSVPFELHPGIGTERQQQWLAASLSDRVRLAEQLGEEGARGYARSRGWTPLHDGTDRTMIHGPDQVYRSGDGGVHVVEAKGGTGQLGKGYGHVQGSTEWAVESAKRVLRNPAASTAERESARAVLQAASKGNLTVHVVRTSHVLGEPSATVLEQTATCTDDAARLAQTALDDIGRIASHSADETGMLGGTLAQATDDTANVTQEIAKGADDVAHLAAEGGSWLKTASRTLLVIGAAADGGFRIYDGYKTEQAYADGTIDQQQREVSHCRNAAGMATGWAGATALGECGALGGGAIGTMVCPGVGTVIGSAVGGVSCGIAGYFGGEWAGANAAAWAIHRVHAAGGSIKAAWRYAWGD